MRAFLKYRLPVALALVLAASCSPKVMPEPAGLPSSWISGVEGTCGAYGMRITFRSLSESCMLAVRRTGDGVRAQAVTWFGMSLFDVHVGKDGLSVNSCAAFLDRRPVLSVIGNTLRCVFLDGGRTAVKGGSTVTRRAGVVCTRVSLPDGRRVLSVKHRLSGMGMELEGLED